MSDALETTGWWAKGLLFENCNCTVVCPGHVHFDQLCTHDRCKGYWAVRIREGEIDGLDLAGIDVVIGYDSPQHMIAGGWTEIILVSEQATPAQIKGVEDILTGRVGGPWAVLDRFVATRLPTRTASIRIVEEDRAKTVEVEGVLTSTVEAIRGRDRSQPVTFENMFNQIYAPSQVIARGSSSFQADSIVVETSGTHGLWSDFHWEVSGE